MVSAPGGVLEVYMTRGGGGGSDVFFLVENLHAWYFFGSRSVTYLLRTFRFVVCKCGAEGRMKRH